MATRFYGSLINRLEENRMFCNEIKVGTPMTEYSYTDRSVYEVVEVKDQKHVSVREMDAIHVGEAYTQNWELKSNPNHSVQEMVRRGDRWYYVTTITSDILDRMGNCEEPSMKFRIAMFLAQNNVDKAELAKKGTIKRYSRANVSFGVADYYYDYGF